MEEEDEDDIYAPDDGTVHARATHSNAANPPANKDEDEEEGEEVEEEESDSDIDIILERDPKAETAQTPRVNALKGPPARIPSTDLGAARKGSPGTKIEAPGKETPSRPGASYPAVEASNLDLDAKPIYEPTGKPITEIDMDTDFPEDDKPWRRPGTDMTDYFNYGFDEFTWASYCLKQKDLRKEVTDMKKQMDDMQNFMSIPGGMPPMPAMPGMPGPPGGGMPAMGEAGDMLPDMQQMMAYMMSQGIDHSQVDQAAFMQMMQAGGGGAGDPSQNFGGQGYGQQGQNQQGQNQQGQNQQGQNQQMRYGYQGGGGGGGRNQGRGQGRRW